MINEQNKNLFDEQQANIFRSVAFNNATEIVCVLIEKGKLENSEEIKKMIVELAEHIYENL